MNHPNATPIELPLLLLRGMVIFPLTVTPLAVSRPAAIRLVDDAIAADARIGVATYHAANTDDFYTIGVTATVHRLVRLHDGTLRIALQAEERITIGPLTQQQPYPRAILHHLPDAVEDLSLTPLMTDARTCANQLLDAFSGGNDELRAQLDAADTPQRLTAFLATNLLIRASIAERQALLELPSIAQRLARIHAMLTQELAILRGHFRI